MPQRAPGRRFYPILKIIFDYSLLPLRNHYSHLFVKLNRHTIAT